MGRSETRLKRARRLLVDAEAIVVHQRQIVEQLGGSGFATREAENLLGDDGGRAY